MLLRQRRKRKNAYGDSVIGRKKEIENVCKNERKIETETKRKREKRHHIANSSPTLETVNHVAPPLILNWKCD